MKKMLRKIAKCAVLALVMTNAAAQDDDLVINSPTTRVVLSNGLTVIVREDHRMPILVSQIWYRVGSSFEHGGITGISHLFEHLMFKGTPRFPEGQFSKIIAINGGQQNAFTSNDFTVYYQQLANDKLAISFELEADRMRNLILKPELLEREKQIVLEERRLRTEDQPPMRAYERFRAAAFVSSSYRYPVIGWADDIRGYTMDDIKNWYHSWYAPNNATIVVVGDVKPDEVITLAEKYFGAIPSQQLPIIKTQGEVVSLGERRAEVNVPAMMGQVFIGYDVPVVRTAQVAWEPYALTLLSAILDGGQSSRLNKELVRKQQIAVEAGTSYDAFERKDSIFTIMATPRDANNMAALEEALYQQIKSLQTDLILPEELERMKTLFIANQIYHKDSLSNQAMILGSLESVGLNIELEKQFIENIQKVTAEQIREVANKYMTPTRRTVTRLNPLPLSQK
jgi:zinc protease